MSDDAPAPRKCTRCGEVKPIDGYSFTYSSNGARCYSYTCKACHAARVREDYHRKRAALEASGKLVRQRFYTDAEGYRICSRCLEKLPHTAQYFAINCGVVGGVCRMCTRETWREQNNKKRGIPETMDDSKPTQDKRYRAQPTGLAPYQGEWVRPTEPITLERWEVSVNYVV